LKRKRSSSEPRATAAEIRERLEVVDRTLTRWFDAGLPCRRGPGGKNPTVKLWDLLEFVYKRKPLEDTPPGGARSPAIERLRLAQAEAAERENALRKGELMKREDARRQVRAIAHALRAQLESLIRALPNLEAELRAAFETAAAKLEGELEEKGEATT
jgi:phage terminase Nu1 subunit (DNA packaging protein)